jgi:hypothetical protein
MLARSGYFPDIKAAAQAAVKIQAGRELGFGPVSSIINIHFVSGKLAFAAGLLAACVRRSGVYDYKILHHDDQSCEIQFTRGEQVLGISRFTIEDAKKAGLDCGTNWRRYPRNMLFARAVSNGARWYCPDLFMGSIYTPDELGAEVDPEDGTIIAESVTAQPRPGLTTEQHDRLLQLIAGTGTDPARVCSHYGVADLAELSPGQFGDAVSVLESKPREAKRQGLADDPTEVSSTIP